MKRRNQCGKKKKERRRLNKISCLFEPLLCFTPTPNASSTPNQSMPGLTTSQPSGQPSPFADSPSPLRCVKYSTLHRVRKALQVWTTSHPHGPEGKHTLHHSEPEEYGPTCSWSRTSFTDDCGASKQCPSFLTRMVKCGERRQSTILRGGQYGTEKRMNGRKMFVPTDPR